jgi:hypothetical protein
MLKSKVVVDKLKIFHTPQYLARACVGRSTHIDAELYFMCCL